jgi:hypothetical protein
VEKSSWLNEWQIGIYVLDFIYQSLVRKTQNEMLNIRLDPFDDYVVVFSFDAVNNRTELRSENGRITWNRIFIKQCEEDK